MPVLPPMVWMPGMARTVSVTTGAVVPTVTVPWTTFQDEVSKFFKLIPLCMSMHWRYNRTAAQDEKGIVAHHDANLMAAVMKAFQDPLLGGKVKIIVTPKKSGKPCGCPAIC
jgi:hypothetical protein